MPPRPANQLRPVSFTPNFLRNALGSVLVEFGNTRVLCAASVQDGAPRWKKEQGVPGGWVTSEYSMLPSSTPQRSSRGRDGKPDARSLEIQRLVGRSLRSVVDMTKLGDHSIYIDCDVIDADGGTRCASICGGAIALQLALRRMQAEGRIDCIPMPELVAAVSVGLKDGQIYLDLDYALDSTADVDMNVVMLESGKFVELQGTAEHHPFDRAQMNSMLDLAETGLRQIFAMQKAVLASV